VPAPESLGGRWVRPLGWCLTALGLAWFVFLVAVAFLLGDIALTYWAAFAGWTGPLGLVALALGQALLWSERPRSRW
jgi:hypothetical protein